MATKTEICNRALEWLGAEPVADVDDIADNSTEALLCRSNYDEAVGLSFENGDWTFATVYAKDDAPILDSAVDDIYSGYGFVFTKPLDCKNLLRVSDDIKRDDNVLERRPWELNADGIHIDAEIIYLKYVYEELDMTLWSSQFNQSVSAYMASVMAIPLTENADLQKTYLALWDNYVTMSKKNDGRQGTSQKTRSNALIRRR